MATEQLVVFKLGTEEYAVSISLVKEIIQYDGSTKLPNDLEYMEGVINLRGKVIPVIDLAAKFQLTIEKSLDKKALIIETAGKNIGLVVDAVTEVIRLDDSAIEATTGIMNSNKFIKGIGKVDQRLLIILDLDQLFSDDEIKIISDVA